MAVDCERDPACEPGLVRTSLMPSGYRFTSVARPYVRGYETQTTVIRRVRDASPRRGPGKPESVSIASISWKSVQGRRTGAQYWRSNDVQHEKPGDACDGVYAIMQDGPLVAGPSVHGRKWTFLGRRGWFSREGRRAPIVRGRGQLSGGAEAAEASDGDGFTVAMGKAHRRDAIPLRG